MARRIETLTIAGPAGKLEALLEEPEDREPIEAALVCHPHPQHGGTMHNKVVYRIARGLRRSGSVVLRFNFRGVNLSEGEYGHVAGEVEDARSCLNWLRKRYADLPCTLAGFSFGSRVALQLGCPIPGIRRIIAVGFPTVYSDRDYLTDCEKPKYFIQSTNDQFGPKEDLSVLVNGLTDPKDLKMLEAQDHFFKGSLEALEDLVAGVP